MTHICMAPSLSPSVCGPRHPRALSRQPAQAWWPPCTYVPPCVRLPAWFKMCIVDRALGAVPPAPAVGGRLAVGVWGESKKDYLCMATELCRSSWQSEGVDGVGYRKLVDEETDCRRLIVIDLEGNEDVSEFRDKEQRETRQSSTAPGPAPVSFLHFGSWMMNQTRRPISTSISHVPPAIDRAPTRQLCGAGDHRRNPNYSATLPQLATWPSWGRTHGGDSLTASRSGRARCRF